MKRTIMTMLGIFVLAIGIAKAQEQAGDRLVVPLQDPSKPCVLKANLMNGSIRITGFDGKEVIVEARTREEASKSKENERGEPGGLKRIAIAANDLVVEEENNRVEVSTGNRSTQTDLVIQVPTSSSLKLGCMHGGTIHVEKVSGEIEINNLNGSIEAKGISGVVVANSHNGNLKVSFDRVTPEKPMSFSTFNGNIDVTLPADTKANLKIESLSGDLYSDFDIEMASATKQPVVKDGRKSGGKYRAKFEGGRVGTINGGGSEIQFKTYNGNIYIRKGE